MVSKEELKWESKWNVYMVEHIWEGEHRVYKWVIKEYQIVSESM